MTSYVGSLHASVGSAVSGVSPCVCTVLVAKKEGLGRGEWLAGRVCETRAVCYLD